VAPETVAGAPKKPRKKKVGANPMKTTMAMVMAIAL
jgi:hypothetical protein